MPASKMPQLKWNVAPEQAMLASTPRQQAPLTGVTPQQQVPGVVQLPPAPLALAVAAPMAANWVNTPGAAERAKRTR